MRHETLYHEIIDYSHASQELLAFLKSLFEAYENKAVDEKSLTSLIWSPINPLLRTDLIPGKAFATKETYEEPLFHIMIDLLSRKRMKEGNLDIEAVKAKYSMSVKEAKEVLGVDATTVRKAFHDRKIAGMLVKGKIWLNPDSVKTFRVSNIGLRAKKGNELRLTIGHNAKSIFKVKPEIKVINQRGKGKNLLLDGVLYPFVEAAILCGSKEKPRFYRIVSSRQTNAIKISDFSVTGRFEVTQKINNPQQARATFEGTQSPYKKTVPPLNA